MRLEGACVLSRITGLCLVDSREHLEVLNSAKGHIHFFRKAPGPGCKIDVKGKIKMG